MHLLYVLPVLASLTAALTIKTPAHLQKRQSAPTDVSIAGITFAGSGCASATSQPSSKVSDPAILTVPQSTFRAASGQDNSRVAETRTTCETIIKLAHPAGWQFSVTKADYYGRVHLPLGSEATSRSTYSFGATTNIFKQYYFDGPFDGFYYRNDRFVGTTGLWSPCGSGSSLNITSEARVAPKGSGASKPASIEIFNFLGRRVELAWRKCT